MNIEYNVGFEDGYHRALKDFTKHLLNISDNGIIFAKNLSEYVTELTENNFPQTETERERINNKIHEYCRGDSMLGKGCLSCVLNSLSVCGDGTGNTKVPMSRLREADKILDEMVG